MNNLSIVKTLEFAGCESYRNLFIRFDFLSIFIVECNINCLDNRGLLAQLIFDGAFDFSHLHEAEIADLHGCAFRQCSLRCADVYLNSIDSIRKVLGRIFDIRLVLAFLFVIGIRLISVRISLICIRIRLIRLCCLCRFRSLSSFGRLCSLLLVCCLAVISSFFCLNSIVSIVQPVSEHCAWTKAVLCNYCERQKQRQTNFYLLVHCAPLSLSRAHFLPGKTLLVKK